MDLRVIMVLLVASMLKGIYGEVGEVDGGSGSGMTEDVASSHSTPLIPASSMPHTSSLIISPELSSVPDGSSSLSTTNTPTSTIVTTGTSLLVPDASTSPPSTLSTAEIPMPSRSPLMTIFQPEFSSLVPDASTSLSSSPPSTAELLLPSTFTYSVTTVLSPSPSSLPSVRSSLVMTTAPLFSSIPSSPSISSLLLTTTVGLTSNGAQSLLLMSSHTPLLSAPQTSRSFTSTLPSPPVSPVTAPSSSLPLPIIISAAAAGIIVAVIVVCLIIPVVFVVMRRKRKRKSKYTVGVSELDGHAIFQVDSEKNTITQDQIINYEMSTGTFGVDSNPTSPVSVNPGETSDDEDRPALVFMNAVDPSIPIVSNEADYSKTLPSRGKLKRAENSASSRPPLDESFLGIEMKASKSTGAVNKIGIKNTDSLLIPQPLGMKLQNPNFTKHAKQPVYDIKEKTVNFSSGDINVKLKENDGYVSMEPIQHSSQKSSDPATTTLTQTAPNDSTGLESATEGLYDVPKSFERENPSRSHPMGGETAESSFVASASHYDVPKKLLQEMAASRKEEPNKAINAPQNPPVPQEELSKELKTSTVSQVSLLDLLKEKKTSLKSHLGDPSVSGHKKSTKLSPNSNSNQSAEASGIYDIPKLLLVESTTISGSEDNSEGIYDVPKSIMNNSSEDTGNLEAKPLTMSDVLNMSKPSDEPALKPKLRKGEEHLKTLEGIHDAPPKTSVEKDVNVQKSHVHSSSPQEDLSIIQKQSPQGDLTEKQDSTVNQGAATNNFLAELAIRMKKTSSSDGKKTDINILSAKNESPVIKQQPSKTAADGVSKTPNVMERMKSPPATSTKPVLNKPSLPPRVSSSTNLVTPAAGTKPASKSKPETPPRVSSTTDLSLDTQPVLKPKLRKYPLDEQSTSPSPNSTPKPVTPSPPPQSDDAPKPSKPKPPKPAPLPRSDDATKQVTQSDDAPKPPKPPKPAPLPRSDDTPKSVTSSSPPRSNNTPKSKPPKPAPLTRSGGTPNPETLPPQSDDTAKPVTSPPPPHSNDPPKSPRPKPPKPPRSSDGTPKPVTPPPQSDDTAKLTTPSSLDSTSATKPVPSPRNREKSVRGSTHRSPMAESIMQELRKREKK